MIHPLPPKHPDTCITLHVTHVEVRGESPITSKDSAIASLTPILVEVCFGVGVRIGYWLVR